MRNRFLIAGLIFGLVVSMQAGWWAGIPVVIRGAVETIKVWVKSQRAKAAAQAAAAGQATKALAKKKAQEAADFIARHPRAATFAGGAVTYAGGVATGMLSNHLTGIWNEDRNWYRNQAETRRTSGDKSSVATAQRAGVVEYFKTKHIKYWYRDIISDNIHTEIEGMSFWNGQPTPSNTHYEEGWYAYHNHGIYRREWDEDLDAWVQTGETVWTAGMGWAEPPSNENIGIDWATAQSYLVDYKLLSKYTNLPLGDQALDAPPIAPTYTVYVTYRLADVTMNQTTRTLIITRRNKPTVKPFEMSSTRDDVRYGLDLLERNTVMWEGPNDTGSYSRRWAFSLNRRSEDGVDWRIEETTMPTNPPTVTR